MNRRPEDEIALCAKLAQSALEVTTSMFPEDSVLNATTGKIEENRYWGFTKLARGLFGYDPQVQKSFWVAYCQKIGMPNAEKVGSFAASISSTKWLFPTDKLSSEDLQLSLNEHLRRLNLQSMPIRLLRFTRSYDTHDVIKSGIEPPLSNWYSGELKVADNAAETIARITGRSDDLLTAGVIVSNIAEELMLTYKHPDALVPNYLIGKIKYHFLHSAACWMVIEDQTELINTKGYSNGNPFLPAVELCQAGYVLFGPRKNGDSTEEYIILDPTVKHSVGQQAETSGQKPTSAKKEARPKTNMKPSVDKKPEGKTISDGMNEIQLARTLVEKLRSLAALEKSRAALIEETAEGLELLIKKLNQKQQP